MNRLYFGDNLQWLSDRKEFPDESVDLVYLDPPFNSNADYNVLFREPSGQVSQAQFHAFTDTWSWADAADTYHQFIDTCRNVAVVELMEALHSFLKHSPMMAYLAMMAPPLVELHRVLKSTGSLYLHCDPTASHYLRIALDEIFDAKNFRNEIVWNAAAAMQISSKEFAAAGAYTTCCCYMRRATRQFGILCLHRMTKIMWNRCIDSSMTKDGGIARVI